MHQAQISAPGIAAWLVVAMVATGCSEPTAQPHATLSVAVSEPSPVATPFVDGTPNWGAGFSVDILLKNQSDVGVLVSPCGPVLEHETQSGEWGSLSEQSCIENPMIELPPKGERPLGRSTFRVTTRPPERVRVLFQYWAVGQTGEADEARSDPFELK
jgi:hypothetical protein